MKNISLLGATGSIGRSVLEVVRKFPEHYRLVAMAAGKNIELFSKQIEECNPALVSVYDEAHADDLRRLIPNYRGKILWGNSGNEEVAAYSESSVALSAIVGAAGLRPTLAAIEAGKDIALANKETLVMAGKIVMDSVKRKGVALLPVDSEHSAIFQALHAGNRADLQKIILTASGGPFHGRPELDLSRVGKNEALAHPNWAMGQKISIDSATLMNKGLEVIEARWLFDSDAIEVVVHPQSIVHSLVEFCDGSQIAQLGIADMCIPIAYALSYPRRQPLALPSLSLTTCGRLDFIEPDLERFPALALAFSAMERGGVAPAVLNAANEVAVASFLAEKIAFLDIPQLVSDIVETVPQSDERILDNILSADREARRRAEEWVQAAV